MTVDSVLLGKTAIGACLSGVAGTALTAVFGVGAAVVATFAAPVLAAVGIATAGYMIYKSITQTAQAIKDGQNATTDDEAQNAVTQGTEGVVDVGLGAYTGYESIKAFGESVKNVKEYRASKVQEQVETKTPGKFNGYSNASEPEVYRFNPNDTTEEILANNPGVSYKAESGKFYIQTSWGEKAYIDTSKEYLVAKYGEGDFNAIDGDIFKQTYVNSESYHASGAHDYIDPTTMKYGQVTTAVKQAPVNFDVAEAGTTYTSLEGEATLQEGSVIMYDVEGNPYQNTIANLIKKNTLSKDGYQAILDGFPEYLEAHPELKEAITTAMQNLE